MTDWTFTHHPRHDHVDDWTFDPDEQYDQWPSLPAYDGTMTESVRYRPKPSGLWLSVDDDWRRYLYEDQGAEPGDPEANGGYVFDVDLDRLLVIDSLAALDEFHHGYVMEHRRPDARWESRCRAKGWEIDPHALDWAPLTEDHAGIVIAPYRWERRLDFAWYYPWDCASAVVWDLSAVACRGRSTCNL